MGRPASFQENRGWSEVYAQLTALSDGAGFLLLSASSRRGLWREQRVGTQDKRTWVPARSFAGELSNLSKMQYIHYVQRLQCGGCSNSGRPLPSTDQKRRKLQQGKYLNLGFFSHLTGKIPGCWEVRPDPCFLMVRTLEWTSHNKGVKGRLCLLPFLGGCMLMHLMY